MAAADAAHDGSVPGGGGCQPTAGGVPMCQQCEEQRCTRVFLVRHGERADEARHKPVAGVVQRGHDPTLTEDGKRQARAAGGILKGYRPQTSFDRVFSSRLVRCLQTAEQIADELDLPIVAVPGLAQCALAVRKHRGGLPAFQFMDPSEPEFAEFCPIFNGRADSEMCPVEGQEDFLPAVERLAASVPPGGNLLVVTHREGLYMLSDLVQFPGRHYKYCSILKFDFCSACRTWTAPPDLEVDGPLK